VQTTITAHKNVPETLGKADKLLYHAPACIQKREQGISLGFALAVNRLIAICEPFDKPIGLLIILDGTDFPVVKKTDGNLAHHWLLRQRLSMNITHHQRQYFQTIHAVSVIISI